MNFLTRTVKIAKKLLENLGTRRRVLIESSGPYNFESIVRLRHFFVRTGVFSIVGQSVQKARTFFISLMMCNNMF